jgi:membrane protein implicated in regulation of membrane protease activity
MAILIKAASPIWRLIIVSSSVLGGILLVGGIVLAILGGSAQTAFTLFGNQFSSTSVGVSLAFIGAVIVVITIRRVLSSVDKITSGKGPSDSSEKLM